MKIKSGPVIHEIGLLKLLVLGPILEELDNFQLMLDAHITINQLIYQGIFYTS